jgi:hypothetical protein
LPPSFLSTKIERMQIMKLQNRQIQHYVMIQSLKTSVSKNDLKT